MWDYIADADNRAKFAEVTVRQELIDIGAQYGFSETELAKRGIITPRENPNPEPVGSTSTAETRCSGRNPALHDCK
jgi:hypothetical protein